MPDGDGQGERLSYSFWFRPDDSFFGNWARTKTINIAAAATTGQGEQQWFLDGSLRDFRIRVTEGDVEWYMRTTSTGTVNDPWLLVRDPFDTGNSKAYDGQELDQSGTHIVGRDKFRIFVHGSASGNDGPATWDDSNLEIDRILVTTTATSGGIDGDYDDSGTVGQTDLDLVLLNWGATVPPTPTNPVPWINQIPTDGAVNQNDLDGVLLNWGNTLAAGAVTAVPEPGTCLLTVLGAFLVLQSRGHRKSQR